MERGGRDRLHELPGGRVEPPHMYCIRKYHIVALFIQFVILFKQFEQTRLEQTYLNPQEPRRVDCVRDLPGRAVEPRGIAGGSERDKREGHFCLFFDNCKFRIF